MKTPAVIAALVLLSACGRPSPTEANTSATAAPTQVAAPATDQLQHQQDAPLSPAPEPVIFYASVPTSAETLSVIVDRETGCQYIQVHYWGDGSAVSVIPRLNRAGRPLCGAAVKDAPHHD